MADYVTFDVDDEAVLFAISTLVEVMGRGIKVASRVTADRIATEARNRVARRTGTTAAGITVEEARDGTGYVVFVRHEQKPGLPRWLEEGTRYMSSRPFLHVSALLEEGAHEDRVTEAINAALVQVGLSD